MKAVNPTIMVIMAVFFVWCPVAIAFVWAYWRLITGG